MTALPHPWPDHQPFRWGEPLQPQELTVTLLGAYVGSRSRRLWSGGLVRLLGDFGFSPAAARIALGRLVRRGLLTRVKHGRLVYYELPQRMELLLAEGDRRIFSFGRLDRGPLGTWTLVSHSLPDTRRLDRARLARRLRFLGFGLLQASIWVAPQDRAADVARLVRELGVEDYTVVVLGRPTEMLPFPALLLTAWDLDDVARRYRDFVEEFHPYSRRDAGSLEAREAFIVRTRLVHAFRAFAVLDPELPADLMPDGTMRETAVELFNTLYAALEPPARAYFDQVTKV